MINLNYDSPDFPEGYEYHRNRLEETIKAGGVAFGAFCDQKLIGFCSLNHGVFGEKYKYILLDQLFINRPSRGKGIGRSLLYVAAEYAKNNGADKIYICSSSAEDTIAFYHAVGCEDAKEINQTLYQMDTRDIQLEYDVSKLPLSK